MLYKQGFLVHGPNKQLHKQGFLVQSSKQLHKQGFLVHCSLHWVVANKLGIYPMALP